MIKVKTADYIISAVKPEQYPTDGMPEIALAGRSNVGKSSLINTLCNRKNLARTSQRPGKTQTLNYYKINESFYMVDVPGYGYAKVSKTERDAWGRMLETFFTVNQQLRATIQIVDLRHAPSKEDVRMYEYLKYFDCPVIVVATKADKISKGKYDKHKSIVRKTLQMAPGDPLLVFSSFTGLGKEAVWKTIESYL